MNLLEKVLVAGLAVGMVVVATVPTVRQPQGRGDSPGPDIARRGEHSPRAGSGMPSGRMVTSAAVAASYSLDAFKAYPPPAYTNTSGSVVTPPYVAVEIGDFTGDGRADVATVIKGRPAPYSTRVLVLAQRADRSLAPAREYLLGANAAAFVGTAMGDFNNDGVMDLLVTRAQGLELLVSDGHGGLSLRQHANTPLTADVPAVALDVNDDGKLDVVGHHSLAPGQQAADGRSQLVTYWGDGHGGFPSQYSTVTGAVNPGDTLKALSMVVISNADGVINDVDEIAIRFQAWDAAAQATKHSIWVYWDDFQRPYVVTTQEPRVLHLGAGDFDSDGQTDLVATDNQASSLDSRLWVYRKYTGALTSQPLLRPADISGTALEGGDLDRDGHKDLVVAFDGQLRIGYYLQRNRQLADPVYRGVGYQGARFGPDSVAIGDINSDLCNDVVVAGTYDGLYVLKGSGCRPRTGGPGQSLRVP